MKFYLITSVLILIITETTSTGIIGIFSSRENFLERHTIRNTWAKDVKFDNTLTYRFVIGDQRCTIPVENRTTIYECRENLSVKSNTSFSTRNYLFKNRAPECASGFGFLANNNFYITHIGIVRRFIELYTFPLRVKLNDASTRRQLASVTFHDKSIDVKAITPVFFPRGSEGLLTLEPVPSRHCSSLIFNNSEGILTIVSIVQKNLVVPVGDHHGLSIFFDGISDEKVKRKSHRNLNELLTEESLRAEQIRFNDILFVNVIDVYGNLPFKLLNFFEKISAYDFTYVIKTDDDSMLDIRRIKYSLRRGYSHKLWWWSTFKEFWAVPRFGKWRENVYKSITYPPFPCGGGYVVSKSVVEYIADMSDNLRIFQGEDVSMGIWLSALKIHEYSPKNELHQAFNYRSLMRKQCEESCSWTCDEEDSHKPRCNLVQLTPKQMVEKWKEYLDNGYL